MEENMLEKKENEVVDNNNNSNKNGIIAILIVFIIALIGTAIYFAFIKKDESPTDNNVENNQQINDDNDKTNNSSLSETNDDNDKTNNSSLSETKIELYVDESKDQNVGSIKLGNKVFEIKLARYGDGKNNLYLNNKKIETIDYDSITVSIVNKYLFIVWPGSQAGNLALGYVNEEGGYFPIYSAGIIIEQVYFENGKFYGEIDDDTAPIFETKKVELILNGSDIKIKEIK